MTGEDLVVTHDDALPFVPAGVRAEFTPARGRARTGEFVPGTGRRPINHGTAGGYRAHFRHGEPMCESCRAAERTRLGYKGPKRAARCGTRSGYSRHVKAGEPTCGPCRDAHNDSMREYVRRTGRVAAPVPRQIKRREVA